VICTNDNEEIAKKTAEYGFHLGLLVQIANDIKDFQSDLTLWGNQHISILYAKDILPELKKKQLLFFLSQQKKREAYRKDIRDLLIENGALIYLGLSIEKHKILARQALLSLALSETGLLTLTRRLDLF
jgi:geranylgeranyl pyrophosphate synthase